MNQSASWSALADVWDELFPLRQARVELCASLSPVGGSLLDAGCATGSLVRALSARGLDARGFDLDPGFVARAKSSLSTESDRVVPGDLVAIDSVFPGLSFDVIVCLGQTFPHLLTDSDIDSFLRGSFGRLKPGGRMVLQVVADRDEHPDRTLPVLEAAGIKLQRRRILTGAERAELHLVATAGFGTASWKVEHRRWSPESLARVAAKSGFATESMMADESRSPWTGAEPGWILVLAKE